MKTPKIIITAIIKGRLQENKKHKRLEKWLKQNYGKDICS